MNRSRLFVAIVTVSLVAGVSGYALRAARADGIPSTAALTYAGYLEDSSGKPVSGPQALALRLYDAADGGTPRCELAGAQKVEVTTGRFELTLPDDCTQAVKANPNLWVEISLAGESLGRTKLGAVPYAVEAGAASEAKGPLQAKLAALAAADAALMASVDGVAVPKMTEWTSYTPQAGTVTSTMSSQVSLTAAAYRREGDSVRIRVAFRQYAPYDGGVGVELPPGMKADRAKIPTQPNTNARVGASSIAGDGAAFLASGPGERCVSWSQNFGGDPVSGSLECLIPIVGWTTTTP
jgi:hypothetical protein